MTVLLFSVIGIVILAASSAQTNTTRLGLHVTGEELAIWRDRWVDGDSDAFIDARIKEEKTRLTSHRQTVEQDVTGHLWSIEAMGTDTEGRYNTQPNMSEPRKRAGRLLSAAFYALITKDAALMDNIGSILTQQPDQTRVQFATDPGWKPGTQKMIDASYPGFSVAHAVIQHLHTYDYHQIAVAEGWAKPLSDYDKNKIRDWHLAFARYVEPTETIRANHYFVDRPNGDYSLTNSGKTEICTWCPQYTFNEGGPTLYGVHDRWNNRAASNVRAMALIGLKYNDTFLRDTARLWLRDWLRYSLFPHGASSDTGRASVNGGEKAPQGYKALVVSHVINAVDAFARTGDTSLYDHRTKIGAHESAGSPSNFGNPEAEKSYLFAMTHLARYGNKTYNRTIGTNYVPLDFRGPFENWAGDRDNYGMHDRFIQANLYYDSDLLRDWYRGENGQPTWMVAANGTTDLNDAWAFPAPYIMWAGLEGRVWPYSPGSTSTDTTLPTVSITSPTEGATVSNSITVGASASDNVSVSKVEFLVNGSVVATDTSAPYEYLWDTTAVSDGGHALSVKATDTSGNAASSTVVNVTVQNSSSGGTIGSTDLNNDGATNLLDFSILASNFGKTGSNLDGDINADGQVDLLDFSLLAEQFE